MPYSLYVLNKGEKPEGLGNYIFLHRTLLIVHTSEKALEILLEKLEDFQPEIVNLHSERKNLYDNILKLGAYLGEGKDVLVTNLRDHSHNIERFRKKPVEIICSEKTYSSIKETLESNEALNSIPISHFEEFHKKHKKKSTSLDVLLKHKNGKK